MSLVKQNLQQSNEANINKLINLKLTASYVFLSLAMHFHRDDAALPNFSEFFLRRSGKERDQAERLLTYQNSRGGRVLLQNISKPVRDHWRGGLEAIHFSLEYQKTLNQTLTEIHQCARQNTDPHLCDFLETHFLSDSHDTIKMLGDHARSLGSIASSDPSGPMGEYLFDKHSL